MRNRFKGSICTIIVLFGLCFSVNAQDSAALLPIRAINMPAGVFLEIDPRVELINGVYSFTSWMQYYPPEGPGNDFFQAVHEFLKPYADHPAIKFAEILTSNGFNHGSHQSFMLSLGPLPKLAAPVVYADGVVSRAGGESNIEAFRRALVDLVAVSRFSEFIVVHRDDYQRMIDEAAVGFEPELVINWMKDFSGVSYPEYHMVLSPTMFSGGYGPRIPLPNGERAPYQIISSNHGTGWPRLPGGKGLTSWSKHEWGHSFSNPAVGKHIHLISKLDLEGLYYPVDQQMRQQSYGSIESFFYEQILRAITTLFVKDTEGNEAFHNELLYQAQRAFMLTPVLVQELERYRANRETYPTFDTFVPELFRRLSAHKNELIEFTNQMVTLLNKGEREQAKALLLKWLEPAPAFYVEGLENAVVQGDFTFTIEALPVEGQPKLTSISVEVDGRQVQMITQPSAKHQVLIDTLQLTDGWYNLAIVATDENKVTHTQKHRFRVSNWYELKAAMDKPLASSWFGDMDFSGISSSSDGWVFIDAPPVLFEDEGRKARTGANSEFMIWETPNLASYFVTLYVDESEVGRLAESIELSATTAASHDAGGWRQLQFTQDTVEKADGWVKVVLTGTTPEAPMWFKLTLKGAAAPNAIQVGEVALTHRRW